MANIYVKRDPHGISPPLHFIADKSVNLGSWMQKNLAPDTGLHCEILLNGTVIASTETMDPERCNAAINVEIGLFDTVLISYRPQGAELLLYAFVAAVAIGAAVYLRAQIPKPGLPSADNDPRDSNNQLNAARNSYRPRLAIPDIAGKIVSYPDFIQPSYYEYQNNQRVFTELFCIGVGQYLVENVKESDTPMDGLPGYQYEIIEPGDSPGIMLNVRTAEASVDVDLVPLGQQLKTAYLETQVGAAITDQSGTITLPQDILIFLDLSVGGTIDFEIQYQDAELFVHTEQGYSVEVLEVDLDFGFITIDHTFVTVGNITAGFIANNDYEGVAPWYVLEGNEINEIWFHLVMPQGIRRGDDTVATVAATLTVEVLDENGYPTGQTFQRGAQFVGKTQSPQRQTYKLTRDDGLPVGRYRARANRITSSLGDNALDLLVLEGVSAVTLYNQPVEVTYEQPMFVLGTFFWAIDNLTAAQIGEMKAAAGDLLRIVIPSMGVDASIYLLRVDPYGTTSFSLVFDTVPAGAVSSIAPVSISITNFDKSDADFGDVTLLKCIRSSSQRVNKGSSNKINAEVTRKLRIFNPDTGVYGVSFEPTRRFCDYAFYLLHDRMGVPIEQINTTELFGITDSLPDPQLGYFDYSFSDGNVSARERLEACCNVARVKYWNEGLLWSFVRIEEKPIKSLMFNRRNLQAGKANYTQQFRRPADHDSVTVIYVDPIKNSEKRVSRRITLAGVIEPGEGVRTNEIKLNGCRNDLQALNRCELEVRRLIYENVRVTDTALNDAQLARLGARVDWIDIYDSDLFGGEVLAVAGNIYRTSERFTPAPDVEYWVYITDINGTPSNSVRCYAVPNQPFAFEATGLTGAFIAAGELQLGSRYVIASNDDLNASAFTVVGRGRPNERGECEIELAEYHPEMFEAD